MEQTDARAKFPGRRGDNERAIEAPWDDIRDAIATGLSFAKVAKQFAQYHPKGWEGMQHVIRKRSQRFGWFVPSTAIGQAKERMAAKGYDVSAMSKSMSKPPSEGEKVETLVLESLAEMGESGSLIAAQLALNQLRAAKANPSQLAPLVDVKDLGAAMKVVRTAAGMDRQASPVSFNLFGGPMSQPGTRDVTVDIRDESGANLGEWSDE